METGPIATRPDFSFFMISMKFTGQILSRAIASQGGQVPCGQTPRAWG
jgi:hypothetical protein